MLPSQPPPPSKQILDYTPVSQKLDAMPDSVDKLAEGAEHIVNTFCEKYPAHLLQHFVGKYFLDKKEWELAERFAIASLKSLPRYGLAYKLLGHALKGKGKLECAASSFHHCLSPNILQKHFSDLDISYVEVPKSGSNINSLVGINVYAAFNTSTKRSLREAQGLG